MIIKKNKSKKKSTNLLELIDHFRFSGNGKEVQKFNLKKPMKEMRSALMCQEY